MKKKLTGMTLMLFLVLPLHARADAPLETIEKQVNRVLDVLRDPALKAESAEETKKEKIRAISNEMFNWNELSRRTLGRNWRKLNAGQQKEFIDLYKEILEKAYVDKILAYQDEKVIYRENKMLSDNKAEVRTSVISKGADIPIHYRMILKQGQWGVYDVIIEGVSLVKNYRTQFRDILAKNSPEELLDILRKKVEKS